jgi:hypothetical protein
MVSVKGRGKDPDLCLDSLLPFLSKLLEVRAFRDHETIEDLLAVEPPKHARSGRFSLTKVGVSHRDWRFCQRLRKEN